MNSMSTNALTLEAAISKENLPLKNRFQLKRIRSSLAKRLKKTASYLKTKWEEQGVRADEIERVLAEDRERARRLMHGVEKRF